MVEVKKIDYPDNEPRVETGPIQFGPGLKATVGYCGIMIPVLNSLLNRDDKMPIYRSNQKTTWRDVFFVATHVGGIWLFALVVAGLLWLCAFLLLPISLLAWPITGYFFAPLYVLPQLKNRFQKGDWLYSQHSYVAENGIARTEKFLWGVWFGKNSISTVEPAGFSFGPETRLT